MKVDRLLMGLFLAVTGVVLFANVWFWTYCFHSDNAMIGLAAKGILNHALIPHWRFPIFVWQVGYQGLLFEASLVALLFELFGVSPRVLHLAPALVYVGFLVLLFQVVARSYGRRTATLTCLFTTLSTPGLYGHVLRTQPNYGETFAMGMILILAYFRLLQNRGSRRFLVDAAVLGLVSGFGMYTYQQIVYFFGVIGLHFFVLLARKRRELGLRSPPVPLTLAGAYFAVALASFLTAVRDLDVAGVHFHWNPGGMLQGAAVAVALCWLYPLRAALNRDRVRQWMVFILVVGPSFLVGLSPRLYYSFVWKLPSTHFGTSGGWKDIAFRAGVLTRAIGSDLNLWDWNPFSVLSGLVVAAAIVWFLRHTYLAIRDQVEGRGDAGSFSPLALLPMVVLPAFLISGAIVDQYSQRYQVVLVIFFALAVSRFLVWFAEHPKWGKAAGVLGLLVLINNGRVVYQSFASLPATYDLEEVEAFLDSQGVTRAYADYWYSYPIDLMSDERIIVEPLYTNYVPYYSEIVRSAQRIALFEDPNRTLIPVTDGRVSIQGNLYTVVSEHVVRGIRIKILDKA